jgi:hypothetical protein
MKFSTWEEDFPVRDISKLSKVEIEQGFSLAISGLSKLMERKMSTIPKLTLEQGIILTGFTGITCCKFSDFQGDVEKRLGHPVWTHQFGDKEFAEKIRELYKEDFLKLVS